MTHTSEHSPVWPTDPIADSEALALQEAREAARQFESFPLRTLHCTSLPAFRTELARDLGCRLDLNPNVDHWECLPCAVRLTDDAGSTNLRVPDVKVVWTDGSTALLDAIASTDSDARSSEPLHVETSVGPYLQVREDQIRSEPYLSNAKALLRYAGYEVSLSDRLQILSLLEERGSLRLSECLCDYRGKMDPVALVAVLALRRFIVLDIDAAPIGPETIIKRAFH